ncbi:MAG TPA: hypothetical protein VHS56_02145 [Candidatus Cybelea sp.]|jgi:hypothetical protein|nr:hypothetical protein [Candidatus Cybelea sp.]
MMRSLAVAGAVALAILTPTVTIAAPTAVVPVYRGAAPRTQARSEAGRATERSVYRAPEINLHPRSLEPNAGTAYPGWHGISEQGRNYVLYQPPPWLQAGCLANNLAPSAAPANAYAPPANTTIGSLVDNQSKDLFSATPSHRASLASSAVTTAATNASGFSFQFEPSQCTPASSITF